MENGKNSFEVPCVVADYFLKLATEAQIKVLLCVLRHGGELPSAADISANTGVSAQEAEDAVLFWQQVNVLGGNSCPKLMSLPKEETTTAKATPEAAEQREVHKTAPRKKPDIPPSEISARFNASTDISELFKMTENALGPLNHTMQTSLIWMHDHLGLRTEVIITLIYYCIKLGKTNTAYIEKIAASWSENEINSLTAAENEIQRLEDLNSLYGQIRQKFGLITNPTKNQREYIEKWQNEGYSLELIFYAYEITVEKTNKISFSYIDKILANWKKDGLATVREVRNAENAYRSAKNAPTRRPADPDVDKYKVVINKF